MIQCCKLSTYKLETNGEITSPEKKNPKSQKLETETCINNYSSQMMLKKEIIKIYNDKENNNNNNEETTFLMETEQFPVDVEKIKKVYSSAKKLILEIMASDISEKYVTMEIDPYGYTNSKRVKKDGITYFGFQNGDLGVDFQLKNTDGYSYEDTFNGRHFMIKFNPDDLNYYIKDLGRGFGTFIKIQEWTELKNNLLLNIGENYIVFSVGDDEDEEREKEEGINSDNNINNENNDNNINCLNIKIFSMKSQKIFTISPDNCPCTIGRSSDNSIIIDDDMLSRIHCTIDFDKDKWYIQDGYAKNGLQEEEIKKSTNGSWIYAYEEIPISDKMIFKANHNLFICNLVQSLYILLIYFFRFILIICLLKKLKKVNIFNK